MCECVSLTIEAEAVLDGADGRRRGQRPRGEGLKRGTRVALQEGPSWGLLLLLLRGSVQIIWTDNRTHAVTGHSKPFCFGFYVKGKSDQFV